MIPTEDIENPIKRPKLAGRDYQAIKPSKGQRNIDELQVMCTNCSQFDSVTNRSVVKVMMKYDARNEMYKCERCSKAVSNATIAYTLKLDLPQYVYWQNEDDVDTLIKEREEEEKYTIVSIVSDPPNRIAKKKIAKVIK